MSKIEKLEKLRGEALKAMDNKDDVLVRCILIELGDLNWQCMPDIIQCLKEARGGLEDAIARLHCVKDISDDKDAAMCGKVGAEEAEATLKSIEERLNSLHNDKPTADSAVNTDDDKLGGCDE